MLIFASYVGLHCFSYLLLSFSDALIHGYSDHTPGANVSVISHNLRVLSHTFYRVSGNFFVHTAA